MDRPQLSSRRNPGRSFLDPTSASNLPPYGRATSRFFSLLFLLIAVAAARQQYQVYLPQPSSFEDGIITTLHGHDFAPLQYRILLPCVVVWLHGVFHLKMFQAFVLVFFACLGTALCTLQAVLNRSRFFRSQSPARALATMALTVCAVLLATPWFLDWARPETAPNCLVLASLLYFTAGSSSTSTWLRYLAIATIAAVSGFVRADVAFTFGVATIIYAMTDHDLPERTSKTFLLAAGVLMSALSGATLLYLMRVMYPDAHYEHPGEAFQLIANLTAPRTMIDVLIAIVFFLFLFYLFFRLRRGVDGADRLAMIAGMIYLPLWLTLGRGNEVRIYTPFMVLMAPTAGKLLVLAFLPQNARNGTDVASPSSLP